MRVVLAALILAAASLPALAGPTDPPPLTRRGPLVRMQATPVDLPSRPSEIHRLLEAAPRSSLAAHPYLQPREALPFPGPSGPSTTADQPLSGRGAGLDLGEGCLVVR